MDSDRALCGKNKEAALESKHNGNDCFAKADYVNALRFYSKAGISLLANYVVFLFVQDYNLI